MTYSERIHAAADFISTRISIRPEIGLILGSGLGDYADTLEDRTVIPFSSIPDFPRATVEGHTGAFVFGTRQGKPVVALQGRNSVDVVKEPCAVIFVIEFKIFVRAYQISLVYGQDLRHGGVFEQSEHRFVASSEVECSVDNKQNNVNTAESVDCCFIYG